MTIALLVILSIISLIGWIWLLVVSFKEHVLWGIGNLLLPFPVAIVFAAMHWQEAKKPFLLYLIPSLLAAVIWVKLFAGVFSETLDIAQQQESGQISEEEAQRRMFEMFGVPVPAELQSQEQPTTQDEIAKLTEQLEQGPAETAPAAPQKLEVYNPFKLSQAPLYLGRTVRITTRSGVVKQGILKSVKYDGLTLERTLRGGEFAFDVRNNDIERLEVQDFIEN